MDAEIHAALAAFAADIAQLPNESAKSHRFVALVQALFPRTSAVIEVTKGLEHRIRIQMSEGAKHGRADAYFGNAVVEFEASLKKSLKTAEKQLREYALGLWQKQKQVNETMVCIASDGLTWRTYRPRCPNPRTVPSRLSDVSLDLVREIVLKPSTQREFWLWLSQLLFRDGRTIPSPEAFLFDFGAQSVAFRDALATIGEAWQSIAKSPRSKLKLSSWQHYLTFAYGTFRSAAGVEELFVRHSYLSALSKLLVWARLSEGKWKGTLEEVAHQVLSGSYFRAINIENLADDDFFQWLDESAVSQYLVPLWERMLSQLLTYDLSRLDQDILKSLYQELVDPTDRHELGEYYTPDWLCEKIAKDQLPTDAIVSVLDPACGSGGFLRAAISHYLAHAGAKLPATERLEAITKAVVGIDIHPLAVTIARSTYALALGPLVKAARTPVHLPVYLADALFLPHEVDQLEIGKDPAIRVEFERKAVDFPDALVKAATLYDASIGAATEVARDHAKSKRETRATLEAFIARQVPEVLRLESAKEAIDGLWSFAVALAELIREDRDSIWSFIVRNQYRPAMLKRRFAVILGNPPWLAYRFISDAEYQREVKYRTVDQYRIGPKEKKLFTQMELASVFFVHALETFGVDEARLAFVMPLSILRGDQHVSLRNRTYLANATITGYWDLQGVAPLFNVPACVLFARRRFPNKNERLKLPASIVSGRLPEKNLPLSRAEGFLTETTATARLIWLGSRNAISTEPGSERRGVASVYLKMFRQGATIVPRSCYFVRVKDWQGVVDIGKQYWCATDPVQAREAKAPYKDVALEGHVEGEFVYTTVLAKQLLPFHVLAPVPVFLPLSADGESVLTASEIRKLGFRRAAQWMEAVEAVWEAKRPAKQQMSAAEYLDFQGKLTAQVSLARYAVLFNHSGTNIAAAVVDRQEHPRLKFDVKVYWATFDSSDEAAYVAGMLNSDFVNDAIKPFQSLGLQGERDIHKKPLELPIPRFDRGNNDHLRIAEEAKLAAEEAMQIDRVGSTRKIGALRAQVRETIDARMAGIDAMVRRII